MFRKKEIDLRLIYGQDNKFLIQPIELDGYKPNPKDFTYDGYIYKPFDEIGRYIDPITFVQNLAIIPHDPERSFDNLYRYNIFVTVVVDGVPNKYVIQNGNVEFIYEHRVPN